VVAPAIVGSNCTVKVAVWPGVNVTGRLAPETEKPVPVSVAEEMVIAAAPVEVKVKFWATGVLMGEVPNARLVALRLIAGAATSIWRSKVSGVPPALAVNMTASEPEAPETAAEKLALVAPAGMVIEAGRVTAPLLLDKLTVMPPVGAAEVSDTEHGSVPGAMTA
jgi:hypothetical protein